MTGRYLIITDTADPTGKSALSLCEVEPVVYSRGSPAAPGVLVHVESVLCPLRACLWCFRPVLASHAVLW